MIEKTSPDATGETFLCPYCQTWLELPPSLKAKHLADRTLLVNELTDRQRYIDLLELAMREKERILETERDHYKFLENLVKALYGEGWDELTINDAKEWNERIAKKNEEIAALISEGGRGD